MALLINAASPQIAGVGPFTGQAHRYGVHVRCHSGAGCIIYFLYGLRAGQRPGAHPDYQVPEII
ncbi:hypothetical protein HS041_28135 [Planomonospora sp. ID67723]|uniref:hypothetical protein n=1 Tax=Planomonospora sp. ID67723 TaxID=2738134 RepID=UPI0018C38845|nr:hypothetical protein [Planomonospora sp. ID67723]MBG0831605.1 hypothetical protein [Planomonospora sp. ID67723]